MRRVGSQAVGHFGPKLQGAGQLREIELGAVLPSFFKRSFTYLKRSW